MKTLLAIFLLIPSVAVAQWLTVKVSSATDSNSIQENFRRAAIYSNRKLDKYSPDTIYKKLTLKDDLIVKDGGVLTSTAAFVSSTTAIGDVFLASTQTFTGQNTFSGLTTIAANYAVWVDSKAANTGGGTSVAGSWFTRTLNTEVFDTGDIGSLTASTVTLVAGTYYCEWSAPCWETNVAANPHRSRLYNVTAGTTIMVGASARAEYQVETRSEGFARFTISAPSEVVVQHRVAQGEATNGLGFPANFGEPEIYAWLKCTKEQ